MHLTVPIVLAPSTWASGIHLDPCPVLAQGPDPGSSWPVLPEASKATHREVPSRLHDFQAFGNLRDEF